MDKNVYEDMIFQQDNHWWFKARKEILYEQIKSLNLKKDIDILEIGCGTGGNLSFLKEFGKVHAMEMDKFSVDYAKKYDVEIKEGFLPDNFPFEKKFDLICMFDVLEHIEKDSESLSVIKYHLKSNGIFILTVPAYQWLYGSHDELLHHKRRYTKSKLIELFKENGLNIIRKSSYFNTILFPLVLLVRLFDKFKFSSKPSGYDIPNSTLNSIFFSIFRSEKSYLKNSNFLFGSSILIVASFK